MYKVIAMGKIDANGLILKATSGITISTQISSGNGPEIGYTVNLPAKLVRDDNYIIQLTPENFGEDGPDYTFTSIATRYQAVNKFEVIIWGDRGQTQPNNRFVAVKSAFHFVIYDLR